MNAYITFCIPSFNRGERVLSLVSSILDYKGNDISVLVVDNASTDDTLYLLDGIRDNRLDVIKNERNIGGIINILKSLSFSKGEYTFLCLDKDFVDGSNIAALIDKLKFYRDVSLGYCSLNGDCKGNDDLLFKKGFESVKHMSYLSTHPSGRFYRTKDYRDVFSEMNIPIDTTFGFWLDVINARMSLKGNSLLLNIRLVYTETKQECAGQKTHTYLDEKIYFYPKGRMAEYAIYMKDLASLPLEKKKKRELFKLLFSRALYASTDGYKFVMLDEHVCTHHGINTRRITFWELFNIEMSYYRYFFKHNKGQSVFLRLYLCWFAFTKRRIKFLLRR